MVFDRVIVKSAFYGCYKSEILIFQFKIRHKMNQQAQNGAKLTLCEVAFEFTLREMRDFFKIYSIFENRKNSLHEVKNTGRVNQKNRVFLK